MENIRFSEIVDFSGYTKEELIDIIRNLQTENLKLQSSLVYEDKLLVKSDEVSFEKTTKPYENKILQISHGYNHGISNNIAEPAITKKLLESVSYAVNHANENIFALDTEGYFIFANKQFLKEHSQEHVIGSYALNILFTINNEEEWEQLKNKIHVNRGVLEYVAVKKEDSCDVSYETVVHSVIDSDGDEAYWFFARDIQIRREQELKIRELNAVMDAILNNIPVYLFVKDTADDFRYLYWNKAFEVHSGIPASRTVGYTDFDFFPSREDAQKFRNDDLELLRSNKRIEYIEDYVNATGDKRIVKTFKLLVPRENNLPLLIGVSWDITDLKIAEQQLVEAKLEAESNRLKSAFLANMSHEIRTPLNAILGFSKLILMTEDEEEQLQFSDIIDRNAELLLQLIDDFLDLSKIEAGTMKFIPAPMDFNKLCILMEDVHRMKVKEGVKLIYDGDKNDFIINNDKNRLAQVFTNLLTNACKFTNCGEIHFGYAVKEHLIECFVKDTGIGIPADKLTAIFDRFTKLNDFAQGTGLGLSITKSIIEKLGGEIFVKSEIGQGTSFTFTIPF